MTDRRSLLICILLCGVVAAVPAAAQAPGNPVEEIRIPWNNSQPLGICVDASGRVWFSDRGTDELAMYDPGSKAFNRFNIPANGSESEIWSIVQDQDGVLWFGDAISNTIWSFDPASGEFSSFPVPTPDSYPFQLAIDPNGTLWFTELYGGKIGELRKGGRIREYPTPTLSSGPNGLDIGDDGRVWFVEGAAKQLASFDPVSGEFQEIPLGKLAENPRGVLVTRSGSIWIADSATSRLIQVNPGSGEMIPFVTSPAVYAPESTPYFLLESPEGKIWFNERFGNKIGVLDPASRRMTEFELPYSSTMDLPGYVPPPCCSVPTGLPVVPREIFGIAQDRSGNLWFTESFGRRIGVVRSGYEPQVTISGSTAPVKLVRNSSATLQLRLTSRLEKPGNLAIIYNSPDNDALDVGSLYVNPMEIRRDVPIDVPVPIGLRHDLPGGDASITISARNGEIWTSVLIPLTTRDVPVSASPTRQAAAGPFVVACAFGIYLALRRIVR
jgi:virginiamycin B lyase